MRALQNSPWLSGDVPRRTFLGATAAFAALPAVARAQAAQHLIVGASAVDGTTGLVAAVRQGYFTKAGIDVEIAVYGGAASAAAVAGGSIQLGSSNLVTLIKAHLNGLPFQLVAPISAYDPNNPTQVLIARNDAGITKALDLNGKTIAVTSLGDLLSTATLAWIDQNGGNSSTVKLVEIPPAAEAAALDEGRVQAAALSEPFLSQALATGRVHIFAKIFDAIAPHFVEAAIFGMPDYINAHADLIQRFARAAIEGNRFANQHPDQTLPWMVEFAKLDPTVMRNARREHFAESLDPAQIQVEIDSLVKLKVIDRRFDARDMISPVVLPVTR
jgi:NitT/TauT family transport system substrate-binding protein